MDWNKRRRGAKSGHLGHLFESQKVSESRIKELANAEKLEVAEITLQEARAQGSEIVHVGWQHVRPGRCGAGDTANQSVQDHSESGSNETKCK